MKRLQEKCRLIELEEKVQERTTDLIKANEKLEKISFTDPLTGLKNRRYLAQNIHRDIELVLSNYQNCNDRRSLMSNIDTDLVFFLMDLDHFKQIITK